MRARPLLHTLPLLALLAAPDARAERGSHDTDETSDRAYSSQASLELPATLTRTAPRTSTTQSTWSAVAAPTLAGKLYFDPLEDLDEVPPALVEFLEHPGQVGLAVTGQQLWQSPPGAHWSAVRRGLGTEGNAEVYFSDTTGMSLTAGARYLGPSGQDRSDVGLSYQLGVIHYFRPTLRAELHYVGQASETARLITGVSVGQLQETTSLRNSGEVDAAAVLLNERLFLRARLQLGHLYDALNALQASGGSGPGSITQGLGFDAGGEATGFFQHDLGVTGRVGFAGQVTHTKPDDGVLASERTALAPYVGAGLQFFFTHEWAAHLDYTATFGTVRGTGVDESNGFTQSLVLGGLGRF
jgi:hypothetical protein